MKHIIFYIRHTSKKRRGQIKGAVVAVANGVGWSLCKKGDKFSKSVARNLALERATKPDPTPVPTSLSKAFVKMEERRKNAAFYLSTPVQVKSKKKKVK